ncbi:MAG: hypothetical protein CBC73_03435 [Flavobacteriales bacterium TMED113]|nr:MAG: hypothetical protein CBC73_03435 [Flavobacteriales bacterium TMED113]
MNKVFKIILISLLSYSVFGQNITIKGKVMNQSGDFLEYVNIQDTKSGKGIISSNTGEYELVLPKRDNYTIIFSHILYDEYELKLDYETFESKLNAENTLFKNIVLIEKIESLDNIDLISYQERFLGITKVDLDILEKIPGYSESIETLLKSLPGVSSNNELSNQYSVRGGSFDENLIYVNGIEIYKSFLVKNAEQEGLSFINPNLISSIEFYPGGFLAKHGDKLSSVLDVRYKRPKKNKIKLSLSPMGTNFSLEGNTKDYRFSYILGHRYKSNQFLINSLDLNGNFRPIMSDLQAYLTYQINPELELGLLAYRSNNTYQMVPENRETEFGTITESLKLTIYFEGEELDRFTTSMGALSLNFKPNENSNIKLTSSFFRTKEELFYDIEGEYWLGQLENNIGSDDFGDVVVNRGIGSYMNHARNELEANVFNLDLKGETEFLNQKINSGIKYQYEQISDNIREWEMIDSAGYSVPNGGVEVGIYNFVKGNASLNSNRLMAHIQISNDFSLNNGAKINYSGGIRSNYWNFNNETFISPRFVIGYKPKWEKDYVFTLSLGSYNQSPFFREIRNKTGEINSDIVSQKSNHYVITSDYQFKLWERPFKFTSSLYYKYLWDIIPYEINNLQINYLNDNIATGYATGIDLKLYGEFVQGVDSWISLSVLSTQEDIEGDLDSDGNEVGFIPKPTDQRIKCSIFFQDYLPKNPKYKFHMSLNYGSGLPFGPNNSSRYQQTMRMPSYKRMDMGFSRMIKEPGVDSRLGFMNHFNSITISAEVFNLLGIRNTASYIWVTDSSNRKYAVPNYLTSRMINIKLSVEF